MITKHHSRANECAAIRHGLAGDDESAGTNPIHPFWLTSNRASRSAEPLAGNRAIGQQIVDSAGRARTRSERSAFRMIAPPGVGTVSHSVQSGDDER
jgi:hypothetical protein